MAVLSTATASGKLLVANVLTGSSAVLYTAPAQTANVTAPSATAYIKEIIIANNTATAATVTITIGTAAILTAVSIAANDTKIMSGLNTMIPAGLTLSALSGTASALTLYISGVEVQ